MCFPEKTKIDKDENSYASLQGISCSVIPCSHLSRLDQKIPWISWILPSVHSVFQPLAHLLKKNAEFVSSEKEHSTFDHLKYALCRVLVLVFLNFYKKFTLYRCLRFQYRRIPHVTRSMSNAFTEIFKGNNLTDK